MSASGAGGPAGSLPGCACDGAGVRVSSNSLRTCVGCKHVVSPDQLVRVTVEHSEHGPRAVLDPLRRLGGRGAWVHPTRECVTAAVRKRAFNRAFRAAVDTEDLGHHLDAALDAQRGAQKESESETDGKPMSAQR